MNNILKQGIVTPFVRFNFYSGSIESKYNDPRYFMSLEHNRTCLSACTFKLTIVYVPDTFSIGEPTLLDNLILSSINNKVTYNYGYCDCEGNIHLQQQSYVGQVYTYNSDIDIASATLTYTVEGTAIASSITNSLDKIDAVPQPKQPSVHLRWLTTVPTSSGFRDLVNMYEINTSDNNDEAVSIPKFDSMPVLDLIMGKVMSGSTQSTGKVIRQGGLVQLSHCERPADEAYELGLITKDEYTAYTNINNNTTHFGIANSISDVNYNQTTMSNVKYKIVTPYIAYIDDIEVSNKYGTLYYRKETGVETNNVYIYELGNDAQQSDVISFSVTYNGANAVAAAGASDNIASAIDADGNNIGQSIATTQLSDLGRNTFPTYSGFNENAFISKEELSGIMLYPFDANLVIMGQTEPNNLLDIIYIIVRLNGAEHPTLTGTYQVLEIVDTVDSTGFKTSLKLRRETSNNMAASNIETYVTNPTSGNSQTVQAAINAISATTTALSKISNQ